MPLVTLSVRKPKSSALKTGVLETTHAALVVSGVPPRLSSSKLRRSASHCPRSRLFPDKANAVDWPPARPCRAVVRGRQQQPLIQASPAHSHSGA